MFSPLYLLFNKFFTAEMYRPELIWDEHREELKISFSSVLHSLQGKGGGRGGAEKEEGIWKIRESSNIEKILSSCNLLARWPARHRYQAERENCYIFLWIRMQKYISLWKVRVRDAILVTRDWNKSFQKYKQEGLQHALPWHVAFKS